MAKFLKNKMVRAWGISLIAVAAVVTTVNVLGLKTYNSFMCNVFGQKRAIVDREGSDNLGGVYIEDFATKEDALKNGNEVTKEICEEGMVLLKNENNALPLKAKANVSVFGKNSVSLVYGGSGSAAPSQNEPKKTIFDSLDAVGIKYNTTLKEFYEDDKKSGDPRSDNPKIENAGVATLKTGESPIKNYNTTITDSYKDYSDAAIIVLSRIAGENWDLPRKAADDPTRHYLELDNNERDLIKHVVEQNRFEHIIILVNSSNMIDLGFLKMENDPAYSNKIDAAILVGSPGANGIMALGEILSGTKNGKPFSPSGHTVDTVYTNYQNDPTWQNFGDNLKENGDAYLQDGKPNGYYFVDYEENIYMGYRYYETQGKIKGEEWYNKNVVYPFGHGLSYTTFEETITNVSALESESIEKGKKFTVEVKVKNTGSTYSGKDVIQLYASAPYTAGGIEKAHKVLVGFAKTDTIEPGKTDTVKITVDPYDFASFDANDKNNNGFKGYELEKGDYTFYASKDAHNSFATFTKKVDADIRYDKDQVTDYDVKPLFEQAKRHLQQNMTRADFDASFPVSPTDADREISDELMTELKSKKHDNPEDLSKMPTTGADITIQFKELIGAPYNDQKWSDFLDQMTFEDMLALIDNCSYHTGKSEKYGIPQTTAADGPTGIVAFLGDPAVYGTTYYCSECLVAQTYNVELAAKQGNAVGNECLLGDKRANGTNLPYTGWYAPGVNLHRSPFGGRNTEYYSEDPFISGKMAANMIAAAQEKGVYTNVKHFALNDEETNRDTEGKNSWCDEQAIRELYLKPFEFAVKEGKTHGVMSSFNRIGTRWTGGYYNLLTEVLRNEWGFEGSVICDFHVNLYMNNKQMYYAGGDCNLTNDKPWSGAKKDSAEDVNVIRRATHNMLYSIVNSNAMRYDIKGYKPAIWEEVVYIVDGTIGAGYVVWGILAFIKASKKVEVVDNPVA